MSTKRNKNNLYTKGYFCKRLKDKGIHVVPLSLSIGSISPFANYIIWSVDCFLNSHVINISCHFESRDMFWFIIKTPKTSFTLKTLSMDVIVNEIFSTIRNLNAK